MRLLVAVLSALVCFGCGAEDVFNDVADTDEVSVSYDTLIRIFDDDFPATDPDSLNCKDILGIYLEWTNTDDQEAGYDMELGEVKKVRRATSKRRWPKKKKMIKEIRDHHLARIGATEKQKKITNRLRACGCLSRLGNVRKPSTSTNRAEESAISSTRKSNPKSALIQKPATKKTKVENPNSIKRPPAHMQTKPGFNNAKKMHTPNSWQQALKNPAFRSSVPPPSQPPDRHEKMQRLQHRPGSLVKETLQALNRHGHHLDAQLADAFAQTLGVESKNKIIGNFNEKDDFGIPLWNRNKQSHTGKLIANRFDVDEKLHIKDGILEGGALPLAEKFQNEDKDIDTGVAEQSSLQEANNDHWYMILIGCLLGVCALLAVSLVVVLCRRRRNKRTTDDIDCKFDTSFKEPTVFVSVASGSISKKKITHGKKIDEQADHDDYDSATHGAEADATADKTHGGDKGVNGHQAIPDYENVIVPPAYHEVVCTEKRLQFEQHV